jgi:exopolysaccharide biosynthesis polyprenyl glycosylphosphotransferase
VAIANDIADQSTAGLPVAASAPTRAVRPRRVDTVAVDALMLAVASAVAVYASNAAGPASSWGVWAFVYPALVLVTIAVTGGYVSRLRLTILDATLGALVATSISTSILLSIRVLFTSNPDAAGQSARQWLFSTVFLAAGRAGHIYAHVRAQRSGVLVRPTLIVGAGSVAQLMARRLLSHPELGLRPVGFLDDDPPDHDGASIPLLGSTADLATTLAKHRVSDVILAFSRAPHHAFLDVIRHCEREGISIYTVPRLFERMPRNVSLEHLGGLPLIRIPYSDPASMRFRAKYAFDRILAAALLLALAPVMGLTAAVIALRMGRPVVFRQRRVGRDGRVFEMLKFRSMAVAPADVPPPEPPPGTAPGGVEGEDRRTRLGTFLRRTSLDELPQLLNVVRGEMSLVGPRPERPEFVATFASEVQRYGERHRMKAGITGWAQVNGLRGKTSLEDRVEWDNYYIENWSFGLDLKILLLTFAVVISSFRSVE